MPQQHPRLPAGKVEPKKPSALAAFADEQPALMNGDAVGRRDIPTQHPGGSVGAAHADPTVHHLSRVQIASRAEGHIGGPDDVAALRADGPQLTGADIERADLAAG